MPSIGCECLVLRGKADHLCHFPILSGVNGEFAYSKLLLLTYQYPLRCPAHDPLEERRRHPAIHPSFFTS